MTETTIGGSLCSGNEANGPNLAIGTLVSPCINAKFCHLKGIESGKYFQFEN